MDVLSWFCVLDASFFSILFIGHQDSGLNCIYISWQGSAHTGPALTPAEVLIAIHDIDPEKDGVALKKVF